MGSARKLKTLKSRKPKPVDVLTTESDLKGMAGFMETLLRRFRTLSFALLLTPLMVVCCGCVGLAAGCGLFVFDQFSHFSADWHPVLHYAMMGLGMSFGFFTYGIALIFIIPAVNFLMPFRVKPFRGPWYSLGAIPWFIHNALTYMVRYTFLEFMTPSPVNVLFYRMMGAKIGKGVVINSTNISDPGLITLGDYVTVGGSATIFGHYGQKGYLIVAPVVVGEKTNIGLKASIMGGVTVGKEVTIKPHTALLPKTVVPDGETV
jgi:hypothetical protein